MDIIIMILAVVIIVGIMIINAMYGKEAKDMDRISKKYNVSKFPVTSRMGNKYYAEVVYDHDRFNAGICCNFYTRTFKKSGRYKDTLVDYNRINFEGFNYNYITIVSQCVESYEEAHKVELEKKRYEEESVKTNKELFNQWDGVIK